MKFVLMIVFVTGSGTGQLYPAFTMQEFDSKERCETALDAAAKAAAEMANTNREIFRAQCLRK